MLKNRADRIPVILILSLTLMDVVLYFTIENPFILLGYFVLMLVPKGSICAWNHHHQHTLTFKSLPINRLLEISYALHTGVTTNLWLLHHVLGHHHNYLDQTKDESRWMRKDGSTMGVIEYTLVVAFTSYYRGFQVGRRYPKHLRVHLIYTFITLCLVTALVAYQPMQAMLIFVLPMVSGLLITAWATYDHHAGLSEKTDHFKASHNNLNPVFNFMTGNLGYHTAHHLKQGMHWSELPALHEEIKDKIPKDLYFSSVWDLMADNRLTRLLGFSQ